MTDPARTAAELSVEVEPAQIADDPLAVLVQVGHAVLAGDVEPAANHRLIVDQAVDQARKRSYAFRLKQLGCYRMRITTRAR